MLEFFRFVVELPQKLGVLRYFLKVEIGEPLRCNRSGIKALWRNY